MGTFTPNIGLYIPAAGETNYNDAFAQGMINLDQHDHTGGPNKGLPITSTGLADFSVTYRKLASDVADVLTGIGVDSTPGNQNRLQILGILKNLFVLSTSMANTGFLSMNGSAIAGRTFQNTASVTWTNADGISGNPSADVDTTALFPVTVPNGGTGLTSMTPYALLTGGTTGTGNLQQVAGLGNATDVLTSNGPGLLPTFQPVPFPTQNLLIGTVTLTASQVRNLSGTPITVIPAQGAGTVIVPYTCYAKLTYGGVDTFHDGSSVRLYYGNTSNEVGFVFTSGAWKDNYSSYYFADDTRSSSTTGVALATWANRAVTVSVNSSNFTGGNANTVTLFVPYSVMSI